MDGVKNLARIYPPPKSAMQSGQARAQGWVLEYEPAERKRIDPLTGWFGSGDTQAQLKLQRTPQQVPVEEPPKAAVHEELVPTAGS